MMVSDKCRSEWPLATVVQIYPSSDDLVRKVLVRVSSGKTYVRDLRKLVLLEESQSFTDPDPNLVIPSATVSQDCPLTVEDHDEVPVNEDEPA